VFCKGGGSLAKEAGDTKPGMDICIVICATDAEGVPAGAWADTI
jgi:hypothetical protein